MKVFEPRNLRPYNQKQSLLFPANLLDFIKDDDLCMVVDDVVNSLDLASLYAKVSPEGNMAYHPKMMLKVPVLLQSSAPAILQKHWVKMLPLSIYPPGNDLTFARLIILERTI